MVVVASGLTEGVVGARYGAVKPLAMIWVMGAHVGDVGAVESEVKVVFAYG